MREEEEFAAQFAALVNFAKGSRAEFGFGTMDSAGRPESNYQLWINCRMTHVFSLAYLLGDESAREYAEFGVQVLLENFYDSDFGGFFERLDGDGAPLITSKHAYGHAFVLLAAASAKTANLARSIELFSLAARALARFRDGDLLCESFDRGFTTNEPYRGANANMHGVEALLAAYEASGEVEFRDQARAIVDFFLSKTISGRMPEHFDAHWRLDAQYNAEAKADPFRPFGVTPGHGIEWGRLCLHLDAALGSQDYRERGLELIERGLADGWNRMGPGIIYTTDYEGQVIVSQKMHWPLCEALAASNVLINLGYPRFGELRAQLWDYAKRYLIEAPGAWHHELNADNEPVPLTWFGKPDVYHAAQAMVLAAVPVKGSVAGATGLAGA